MTVNVGLSSMLSPDFPQLQDAIDDAVARCSLLWGEASRYVHEIVLLICRLLNGFAIWCLENGKNLPCLEFGKGIMRQIFQALIRGRRDNPFQRNTSVKNVDLREYLQVYFSSRPEDLELIDGYLINQLISHMAKQYATNCMNHVQMNFEKFLHRWIKYKLEKHIGYLCSSKQVEKLVQYILRQIRKDDEDDEYEDDSPLLDPDEEESPLLDVTVEDGDPASDPGTSDVNEGATTQEEAQQHPYEKFLPAKLQLEQNAHYKFVVINAVEHIIDKAKAIVGGRSLDKSEIKKTWWSYLKPMRMILKTFVQNCRADAEERVASGRRGRGLRLFTLVPISSLKAKHIHIDTTALYELLKSAEIGLGNIKSVSDFRNPHHAINWWNRAFNINRVTYCDENDDPTSIKARHFAFSVTTNGLQLCVHINKRSTPEICNKWGYDADGNYHRMEISDTDRLIGLDPGRGNLFVAAVRPSSEVNGVKDEIIACSNREWREISGAKNAEKTVKTWMRSNEDIQQLATNLPTACCITTESYKQHLEYFLQNRDRLHGFYGARRWKRLRWKTMIQRQRAYNEIHARLSKGDKNTVIAYGGGKFHHASRGHPPTPNKHLFVELKRRCKARLVDEFRTSKRCSKCHAEADEYKRLWSVKKCTSNLCLTLWNRDVNAARNIRNMFVYRNDNNGESPEPFKRKKKKDNVSGCEGTWKEGTPAKCSPNEQPVCESKKVKMEKDDLQMC